MIGIIPAAGKAARMAGIPKMLLPTPEGILINVLIARMQEAQIMRSAVYVGINQENSEILRLPNTLFYAVCTDTMSETVLLARKYAKDESVLFGMPDSYWEDTRVYARLTAALDDGAMVAAALFATRPEQRQKLGMCEVQEIEEDWRITSVADKPAQTHLTFAWGALAWTPDFWRHIAPEDPHVGYALQRAVAAGVDARAVFTEGGYWDCGTPDEYFALIRHLTASEVVHG
jgi:dTDP-glucose pyrophosphorylase